MLPNYNLACIAARMGDLEKAQVRLEQAVARGYRDADHLSTDPDLAPLRESPKFKALVDRLR